jgi:hypothetical protein
MEPISALGGRGIAVTSDDEQGGNARKDGGINHLWGKPLGGALLGHPSR